MCWILLGIWMAWIEKVYGKQEQDIPDASPEIPEFFKADPAVREAQLIVRGKSNSRPITDGRVVR